MKLDSGCVLYIYKLYKTTSRSLIVTNCHRKVPKCDSSLFNSISILYSILYNYQEKTFYSKLINHEIFIPFILLYRLY